ncbi:polyhomeotic-like protein 3 isoform 1-T2 [Polymixia lowei]
MERELVRQSQAEHGEATNGTGPTATSFTPATPTPPRLTPNPTLLDCPPSTLTPTSSSPPPPLTPAPSLSASHTPKVSTGTPSPHALIPAPPKLTSNAGPPLRTYARPILPSGQAGRSKTPSSPSMTSPGSSLPAASSVLAASSSSGTAAGSAPLPVSSSGTYGNVTASAKTSAGLTNGNARSVSAPTSTPITPFHTPASPTGRQVPQAHPLGTPGLVRTNQSSSPVRQRVSQQTLLLGKGPKVSGQDQVLLRAQMLQSLTLRPPPPGTLTIPPSLRLKPPSSTPPPLSRPRNPLFPPLRPRPQPSTTATESPTTPTRHLSVPPPTLYSPVRAVPLRPRLHSPNGHRMVPPRQTSTFQPITAAPAGQIPPINRHLAGFKSCPLSHTAPPPSQSQHSSISASNPMTPTSHFERSPSAARQLQIIALSSGRQSQSGNAHAPVQSAPSVVQAPEIASQSQRTLGGGDALPLPLKPSLPKTTSPLPSPPSLLRPSSPPGPPGHPGPQAHTPIQQGEKQGGLRESKERRDSGRATGLRQGTREEGGIRKDPRAERDDQREREKVEDEERTLGKPKEQRAGMVREEEKMDVTEEGQSDKRRTEGGVEKEEEEETAMDQSENLTGPNLHQYQNLEPNPKPKQGPVTIHDSNPETQPIWALDTTPATVQAPTPALIQAPTPALIQAPTPAPIQALTPAPIQALTPAPIQALTPAPIQALTPAPIQALTPAPIQAPTPAPIQASTPAPIQALTPAPIQALTPAAIQAPTPATVQALTPAPIQALTPAPIQALTPAPIQALTPALIQAPTPATVQAPTPTLTPAPAPVPELSAQSQRMSEPHRDLQPVSQEDFCENMSTQSDNQSALSSLSSQSPPTSPCIVPSADNPPPLLPAQPAHPDDFSLSQHEPEKVSQSQEETEPRGQSEDELESFGQPQSEPWAPKAWPEGREVLTHLVEGFVIQEGLQPFPVNRSSLLVQEQVSKPPEVNGTNGREASPVTDKQTEHSTDSEDEEGGATDDPGTRSSQRDRAVLHCQFCGKRGHAHNFMRSKRFCSTSCARGFNVRLTKRLRALSAGSRSERPRPALNRAQSVPGKPLLLRLPRDLWSAGRRDREEKGEEDEEEEEEEKGGEDPSIAVTTKMECRAARRARRASEPAVTTSTPTTTFKSGPAQWSVEEVTAFIHTLPGCSEVAEAFRIQEIDGQALLLLTEDHLMTSMNIKLGPALKICAHINALKHQ